MKREYNINEWFHGALDIVLPDLHSGLALAVYSRIFDDGRGSGGDGREVGSDIWELEAGTEINVETATCYVKYQTPEDRWFYDSRAGKWEQKKQLLWKIYALKNMPESTFLKNFLAAFLKKLESGFLDCKMFESSQKETSGVLEHIFSEVLNQEYFLQLYIDEVLEETGLPDKAIITQMAAQMYEKRPLRGEMVFLTEQEWEEFVRVAGERNTAILSLDYVDPKQRKLKMENMRTVRKLLELNTEDTCMIATLEAEPLLRGIIAKKQIKNPDKYVSVLFKGYLKWEIRFAADSRFSCDNGRYHLCFENDLRVQCERELAGLDLKYKEDIIDIIINLANEKHGTSIIFMDQEAVKDEVDRLSRMNRCIKLGETYGAGRGNGLSLKLYLEKISGITAIDGALLADLCGKVYGIGTILDGEAVKPGKVSRGARYNSVKNYLYVKKKKCEDREICIFGAIISEDETVDIVIPEEEQHSANCEGRVDADRGF